MAYEGYSGRCAGRLLYFLYKHSHRFDEMVFSGDGKTILDISERYPIATYEWKEDTDIPVFKFFGEFEKFNEITEQIVNECVYFDDICGVPRHSEYCMLFKDSVHKYYRRQYFLNSFKNSIDLE